MKPCSVYQIDFHLLLVTEPCMTAVCPEQSVCAATSETTHECVCNDGYSGSECTDVDECAADPSPCDQICTNNDGGFIIY